VNFGGALRLEGGRGNVEGRKRGAHYMKRKTVGNPITIRETTCQGTYPQNPIGEREEIEAEVHEHGGKRKTCSDEFEKKKLTVRSTILNFRTAKRRRFDCRGRGKRWGEKGFSTHRGVVLDGRESAVLFGGKQKVGSTYKMKVRGRAWEGP